MIYIMSLPIIKPTLSLFWSSDIKASDYTSQLSSDCDAEGANNNPVLYNILHWLDLHNFIQPGINPGKYDQDKSVSIESIFYSACKLLSYTGIYI